MQVSVEYFNKVDCYFIPFHSRPALASKRGNDQAVSEQSRNTSGWFKSGISVHSSGMSTSALSVV